MRSGGPGIAWHGSWPGVRQDSCDGISCARNMERVQQTQLPPLCLSLCPVLANVNRNLLAFSECAAQKERSQVLFQPLQSLASHPKCFSSFRQDFRNLMQNVQLLYRPSVRARGRGLLSQRFPEVQLSATTFVWPAEGEALSGAHVFW